MERSTDDEVQNVYRGSNETVEHFYAKGMRDAVQSRRDDLPSIASLTSRLLSNEESKNGLDKRDDVPSSTSDLQSSREPTQPENGIGDEVPSSTSDLQSNREPTQPENGIGDEEHTYALMNLPIEDDAPTKEESPDQEDMSPTKSPDEEEKSNPPPEIESQTPMIMPSVSQLFPATQAEELPLSQTQEETPLSTQTQEESQTQQISRPPPSPSKFWTCEFCTFINTNPEFLCCEMCNLERVIRYDPQVKNCRELVNLIVEKDRICKSIDSRRADFAVGKGVSVFWPEDARRYSAVVTRITNTSVCVQYDADGSKERINYEDFAERDVKLKRVSSRRAVQMLRQKHREELNRVPKKRKKTITTTTTTTTTTKRKKTISKKRKATSSKSQTKKKKKKKKKKDTVAAADNRMYSKTARILMKLLDKFNVSYMVEDIERMRSDYGDSNRSSFDHSHFYKTVVDSFIQEGGGDHSNLVQAHTRNNFYRDCAVHTIRKINKGYRGTYVIHHLHHSSTSHTRIANTGTNVSIWDADRVSCWVSRSEKNGCV